MGSDTAIITAIASRNQKRAELWAKKHSLSEISVYGSYDELLKNESVNAVYIPLPTVYHAEYSIKAANAGKHVLCEKPVGNTFKETQEIIKICNQNNVLFMDGVMWVHHPRTYMVKNRMESIGDLRRINSVSSIDIGQEEALDDTSRNIRLHPDLEPLGALGDLGWYCIRSVLFACDYKLPIKVYATAKFNSSNVPVNVTAILWFSGNVMATFDCQFDAVSRQSLEIRGTTGSVILDDFVLPQGSSDVCASFIVRNAQGLQERIVVEPCVQEQEMIRNFCHAAAALRSNAPNRRQWSQEILATQRVVQAVMESLSAKTEVELDRKSVV